MSTMSRRGFLVAGAAGTAAAGVLVMTPANSDAAEARRWSDGGEPLVIHVAEPTTGELTIHTGDRSTVVRDRALVARLVAAAAGSRD